MKMSVQPGVQAGGSGHVWSEFEGEHEIAVWNANCIGRLLNPAPLC